MDLTLQAAVHLAAELHEATTARAAERASEGRDAELRAELMHAALETALQIRDVEGRDAELRAELSSAEERAEELLDEVTWLVDDDDDDDDDDGDSEHCSHF